MDRPEPVKGSLFRNQSVVAGLFTAGLIVSGVVWPLLNSILTLCFLAWWLFMADKSFSRQRLIWIAFFSLPYLIVVASAFYSANLHEAIATIQLRSPMMAYPLIYGTLTVVDNRFTTRALLVFCVSITLGILLCVVHGSMLFFADGEVNHFYGYQLVWLKGMTPYTFSLCLLVNNLFLLYFLRRPPGFGFALFKKRWIYALMLFMSFGFLLVLGNRNMLLLSILLILYFVFVSLPGMKLRIISITAVVLLVVLGVTYNPFLRKQVLELAEVTDHNTIPLDVDGSLGQNWGGSQIRLAIWRCALPLIMRHPVTGVGAGDIQDSLQQAYEDRKFYFASRYNRYNAHNQYVQEAVGVGIPGAIIWLAVLLVPCFLKVAWRNKELMALFLLAMAWAGLTDTPLDANKTVVFYSLFNSILFFPLLRRSREDQR